MVTKVCEQCGHEQDIEEFYRRPQKNNPECRIKICKTCYSENTKETRRRQEEFQHRWKEEQEAREAERRAQAEAREQAAQARQARSYELSLQAKQRCPRCHQPRTDGDLWILTDGREHLHFSRYCENCTNSTLHAHYVLICPRLAVVRYTGITSQPLKKRLAGHLREGGTEQKRAWIESLRADGLVPRIEQIDESPNEKIAKEKEQQWIDYYLARGCPLTNGEAQDIQRVLDVQSGRIASADEGIGSEDWKYWRRVKTSAQSFRWECSASRQLAVKRWHNRSQRAYFLDTTYNQWIPHHHYKEKAREYDQAIFEHQLPIGRAQRRAILASISIAYVYWRETEELSTRQVEDVQFLLKCGVPIIGDTADQHWHSSSGWLFSLSARRPLIHPFHYTSLPEQALISRA
jgi:hypothetical protein